MHEIDIEKFLDLNGYDTEIRKSRRKNNKGKNTAEFFTPYSIVKSMCDKIEDKDWADPDKTFLEPCFGNGQILIYMIYKRLINGIELEQVLKTTYGVELCEDNVIETKQRILNLLNEMEINYNKESVIDIMNKNFVCHDFFTWNSIDWKPIDYEK